MEKSNTASSARARRVVLLAGGAAAAVLLALQCIRPDKNRSADAEGRASLVEALQAPAAIRTLLANACYDCHSDNTRYPWYAEVQPVGWMLARHVRDGKAALNLSTFANLPKKTQAKRLNYMLDAIAARDMPLRPYTWLHRDAVLTEAQLKTFATWAEVAIDRLEKEAVAAPGGT